MPYCPVCSGSVDLLATRTLPFCCERCRLIDLGRWLDEAYSVPEIKRSADEELEVESQEPEDIG
ncbi:MAG: DNA gyrase inhibitor YacG [Planctomycetaceae bacterium]|jgi:uncharacterized protein|nr:DNA gyrase inhibitor YacG [Planctomycetia bacterium]PHY02889.1 MAG: DNA gyrase inhibitor YacG [Planctomycetaceae bacterium]RLS67800.1 MAG: DNA gyrase inhibitor YacG [Planctomycetota bacterium]